MSQFGDIGSVRRSAAWRNRLHGVGVPRHEGADMGPISANFVAFSRQSLPRTARDARRNTRHPHRGGVNSLFSIRLFKAGTGIAKTRANRRSDVGCARRACASRRITITVRVPGVGVNGSRVVDSVAAHGPGAFAPAPPRSERTGNSESVGDSASTLLVHTPSPSLPLDARGRGLSRKGRARVHRAWAEQRNVNL